MAAKGVSRTQSNGVSEKKTNGTQMAKGSQAAIKKKHDDYTSEGVSDHDIFALPSSDYQLLGILTLIAAFVRLFRIYQPSSVVFDEVHFGGFASKYIKGRFFMDVHPPLAKLLLTLAGWLAGFNGDFDFKDIGKDYLEPGVPYVAMRLVPAIFGVLTVPTIFLTLKAYGCRTTSAALGAGLVIFENGLLTQSRLILLDSPLVIFTAFTALSWTCFTNQHEQGPEKAFEPNWWFWLVMTGLGLGATVSVKWVGLFTIFWVGCLTVLQLWVLLGDTKTITPRLWFKHFLARAFCLILIPVTFYMGLFAIHFVCLVNPGDGDGFMSSEFQATLNSKAMQDVPVDVALGSRVSLRHHNTQGGYLHSHHHMYPTGSKQQQITLYPHKDENNVWLLENQTQPEGANGPITGPKAWDTLLPLRYVEDGTIVRLYHVTTDRRLHSHDVRPPITEADWQNEVSAYGYEGFEGDANDLFRVDIIKSMSDGAEAKKRVRTIQTKFKLVHIITGCVLFSHKVKLPDWAFEQQEVTCAKGGTLPNSVWYIEGNEHPLLGADAEKVNYRRPNFFSKFWELQKVMWRTNAGLIESHTWDSRPPSWPVLRRGINFWGKDHRQIYLMGNPVIWWSSTLAVVIYAFFKGLAILRWQRGFQDYQIETFKRFDYEIGTSVFGWACHYFPFFLMQRQLFLHHYFPALYFAIMSLCQIYDFVTSRVGGIGLRDRPAIARIGAVVFLSLSIVAFSFYAPLAYGNVWTQSACKRVKLIDTWDWDCNAFHTDLSKYSTPSPLANSAIDTAGLKGGNQAAIQHQQAVPQKPLVPQEQKAQVSPEQKIIPDVPLGDKVVKSQEQHTEYRDQYGNLLNEDQVAALAGQVSFSTHYETRTRLVDAQGNVIAEGPNVAVDGAGVAPPGAGGNAGQGAGVAPPHPDIEGRNPETAKDGDGDGKKQDGNVDNNKPATADAMEDLEKERRNVEKELKEKRNVPRPGSEGNQATGK